MLRFNTHKKKKKKRENEILETLVCIVRAATLSPQWKTSQ